MLSAAKLMFMAFFTLIIGLVLIQPIGDDIETAKLSSRTTTNESVTLTVTTANVANETIAFPTLTNSSANLTNKYLTAFTNITNITSEGLLNFCNVTLTSGRVVCNATGSLTAYIQYTYNQYSTGTLTSDELISFDACRNSTMTAILANTHCNVTLATGAVKVKYNNFTDDLAYIDYKYEPDTYVHSRTARTLLTQTRLLFAIAILLIGIGFAIAAFKQSGAT